MLNNNINLTFVLILKLVITKNELIIQNYKITVRFLACFFFFLPKYQIFIIKNRNNQLIILLITKKEI